MKKKQVTSNEFCDSQFKTEVSVKKAYSPWRIKSNLEDMCWSCPISKLIKYLLAPFPKSLHMHVVTMLDLKIKPVLQ